MDDADVAARNAADRPSFASAGVGPPGPPPPPAWAPPPPAYWGGSPPAKPRSRRTLWIVVGVVVLLLLALVGSCALFLRDLSTQFAPAASVINVSRGQIDSFRVNTFNGRTTIIFQAAQGVDATDGPDLACRIVKPTLANTSAAGTAWVIVNRAGDAIASNETPCP